MSLRNSSHNMAAPPSTCTLEERLKCDGPRAETRFRLSAKRTSPFKSAGGRRFSRLTTGSRDVRISGSNAGYTMFRGSVKGTGYPFHSPVSPSLPIPCVTVCHHISTAIYQPFGRPCCQPLPTNFSLACQIWVPVNKNRTVSTRYTIAACCYTHRTTVTDVTESHATCFVQQNKTPDVTPSKSQNAPCAQREGPEQKSPNARAFANLQVVKQSTAYITYPGTNKHLRRLSPGLQTHSSGNSLKKPIQTQKMHNPDGRAQCTEHTIRYIRGRFHHRHCMTAPR